MSSYLVVAQYQMRPEIQKYLKENKSKWSLTDQDINNWRISDQYTNKKTGITYTYIHQEVSGIRVFNAVSTVASRDGRVIHYANRFIPNASKIANSSKPALRVDAAIQAAAKHLGLTITEALTGNVKKGDPNRWTYNKAGIAKKPIEVELMYVKVGTSVKLAYNVNIAEIRSADWWNVRIDAQTGKFLEKNNWTVSCDIGPHSGFKNHSHTTEIASNNLFNKSALNNKAGAYNVFAFPEESPNFGSRVLINDPSDIVASPYGWHDTNGFDGAEYTITRGNNVYAYEDRNNQDKPGYSPDGGPSLNFDFPLDLGINPDQNQDAIITNLFYVNNTIHDVLFHNGFDEESGNFQATNYSGLGLGDDYVLAEAQDGGGTSNANFSTPDDGQNGVMQMYLWPTSPPSKLKVNTPASIAGDYSVIESDGGVKITTPITSNAVLVKDGTSPFNDGCETITNAAEIAGKIAVVERGLCNFSVKLAAANAAGAIAVIVINNKPGTPVTLPGINIPSVMMTQDDGALIEAQLKAGTIVNITLNPTAGTVPDLDGSLDNGIVAHEFGHGVSTRLTGGPSNSNCLNNGEEGGEGWSDWLAMVMTIEPGDKGTDVRGMGTYALGELKNGSGIRRYPYSTNMAVNPQTYGDLATSGEVHDIGEIWCQVLWDMSWKLIDKEGFDQNLYTGKGGNNTAIQLVLEGMKLQPCGPGFLDGRDGILGADELLFNSKHRCDIWEAFAGRGMGVNADQGSPDNAGDETENFELPTYCQTAVVAPKANFVTDTLKACYGQFKFTDMSTDIPQEWLWVFGDGDTSNAINPTHIYTVPGTYTVTLKVSNTIGEDTHTYVVVFDPPAAPSVSGETTICEGNSTTLTANLLPGNTANWLVNGNIISTGTSFTTPVLLADATYEVQQLKDNPKYKVGPLDNTISNGGFHLNGIEGQILFEAFKPFTLKSALVYANGTLDRTFHLFDESGKIIQTVVKNVPDGSSRVDLNFDIPAAGKYSVGNPSQNLFRNNSGANYPYVLNGIVTLYNSNAQGQITTNYYYYLYDWEIQEPACPSLSVPINIDVKPGPVANFGKTVDNLTVSFTDSTSNNPTNWSWDFGDGSTSNVQNPTHTYAAEGFYNVILIVSNGGCTSTYQQTIEVKNSTGTHDLNSFGTKLYPNPATNQVTVELNGSLSGVIGINITDALGQIVHAENVNPITKKLLIDTSAFSAGVYYVQVKGKEGYAMHKLTLQK